MRSGKAYVVLLLIAVASLIGFYIALARIQPVDPKYKTTTIQFDRGQLVRSNENGDNMSFLMRPDRDGMSSMGERVAMLRRGCQERLQNGTHFDHIQRSKLDHIIVNDEYKLLYCYVPKVACTNLKRIFLLLTGKMNQTDPLKLPSGDVHDKLDKHLSYLDELPINGIKYRLQTYKKIMFVREPLERTLSAYRNKFLQKGNQYFKERFGRRIIKQFRKFPTDRSLEKGDDVTYTEFVQYLLHPKTIESGYNEHWATFTDLCHPCHIQYDFIGKYESIDEDVNFLLEDIGVSDIIKFPERGDMYKTLKTEDMLYKYYKDLTPESIKNLSAMYASDFQLFGYDFPNTLNKLLKHD